MTLLKRKLCSSSRIPVARCVMLGVLCTTAVHAGGPVPEGSGISNLAEATLEELMAVQVHSVGRKNQKLSSAAAAVFVVTQDDIRRSGAVSVPEILRRVPGLQVARIDSSKWAVSARGFNGRFSNKMLVLIDGRSIYTNLYSGVYWDQNDLLLEDIERIEVIRGPGATMWGANAVNGVINIITKKAAGTQGVLLTTGSGTEEKAAVAARFGGRIGETVQYRAFGKFFNRNQLLTPGGSSDAPDGWNQRRGGARLDWQPTRKDSFTFAGDTYSGEANQCTVDGVPLLSVKLHKDTIFTSGGYGLSRWERQFSERSATALQVYYNQENRQEVLGDWHYRAVDFDFQQHYTASARHDLVFGGGYRRIQDHMGGSPSALDPESRSDNLSNVFLQDDIALLPDRLVLTLGTKLSWNSYTGFELQPGVRLIWTPTTKQSLWSAVSRAVRTPARSERDISIRFDVPAGVLPIASIVVFSGSKDFQSENMIAYEAGYRNQLNRRVSLDVAAFYNHYSSLQSQKLGKAYLQAGSPLRVVIPLVLGNANKGRTQGVEVATKWEVSRNWRVSTNYSWLNMNVTSGNALTTPDGGLSLPGNLYYPDNVYAGRSPAHTIQASSSIDLGRHLNLDTNMSYVSELPGIAIPAYTRLDVRLAWRRWNGTELSAGVNDLLQRSHTEFVPDSMVRGSDVRRGAYVKLTWGFVRDESHSR